ncbi:MAG: hypothetical protein ACYS74_05780, partial [Planctomycetota bacterium]
ILLLHSGLVPFKMRKIDTAQGGACQWSLWVFERRHENGQEEESSKEESQEESDQEESQEEESQEESEKEIGAR